MDWLPADAAGNPRAADRPDTGTYHNDYPVWLEDGARLVLPLKPLPGGDQAIALLMANQTSFAVERHLVARMTELVRTVAPEAVVGIPTLGLTYARPIAEAIGLPNYVALGHSRKFWYDDHLSEAVVSATSPTTPKRVYLDPGLWARVYRRRVVIVDDVLNTGGTMGSAVRLLRRAEADVVGIVAVLTEGWDWHAVLTSIAPTLPRVVRALGHIPLFGRDEHGWKSLPHTEATARPAV